MQRVAILYDASQAVLSTFDLDEVLNQVLEIVRDYFHLQSGSIMLLDESTQQLSVRAHFGDCVLPSDVPVPFGKGIAGTAAKARRPIYSADVTTDPRYLGKSGSTRSELAIPLMVRDEVVGVLDCQSDRPGFFDNETVDLLTLFATQASIGLQNAKLYSMLQRRAAQLEAINAIAKRTTVESRSQGTARPPLHPASPLFSRRSCFHLPARRRRLPHPARPAGRLCPRLSKTGDVLPEGYAFTTERRRPRRGQPSAGLLRRKSRTPGLCHHPGQSVPAQ